MPFLTFSRDKMERRDITLRFATGLDQTYLLRSPMKMGSVECMHSIKSMRKVFGRIGMATVLWNFLPDFSSARLRQHCIEADVILRAMAPE